MKSHRRGKSQRFRIVEVGIVIKMLSGNLLRRNMKPKLLHAWVSNRASDLRMMVLVYTAATIGTLFLVRDAASFGSEMQFAIAAAIISFGVNAIVWFDGAIADIGASTSSMDEELASSEIGKNFKKAPFIMFRLMALSIVVVNSVAQVIALYA